jgi:hypothetical protein
MGKYVPVASSFRDDIEKLSYNTAAISAEFSSQDNSNNGQTVFCPPLSMDVKLCSEGNMKNCFKCNKNFKLNFRGFAVGIVVLSATIYFAL